MHTIWSEMLRLTGANAESGVWYGFWSGFGGSIPDFLILAAIVTWFRQHNCHVKGCWWLQRKTVAGTDHVVCHKHHPHGTSISHAQVLLDHARANQ